MITRRRALALGACAAAVEPASLKEAAGADGIAFGAASEVPLTSDPDYASLLVRECDQFAPNLNWRLLAPTPADTLAAVDPSIAVVTAKGLSLTGYHLLWYQGVPPWFPGLDRSEAERAVAAHVAALGARFGGQTRAWNVVNEAIDPAKGRADGLRPSPFLQAFGTDYLELGFHLAQEAAPHVIRVLNEYDLELATPAQEARRTALLRLLDVLQARAAPVQAVGLQCHLRADDFVRAFDPGTYRAFLREIAGRGLQILLTEMDVFERSPAPIPVRDNAVAEIYRRFLDVALDEKAVTSLTLWGLSDRYTWLNDPGRASFRRPDGTPGRPLPFDDALRPKPALTALQQAIAAAPRRGC